MRSMAAVLVGGDGLVRNRAGISLRNRRRGGQTQCPEQSGPEQQAASEGGGQPFELPAIRGGARHGSLPAASLFPVALRIDLHAERQAEGAGGVETGQGGRHRSRRPISRSRSSDGGT